MHRIDGEVADLARERSGVAWKPIFCFRHDIFSKRIGTLPATTENECMTTSGELFEQEFETWTPAQAKAFFRAGMVDDFFVTDIGGELWVLTLIVISRQGRQMQIQLRTARELDVRKVRQFKTLDAA
ncbi:MULTISPECIES: hypothetical protein, partial [unclassified Paraburkholderia]|uniref:hypothetical protein n=1 Tax=unclassified Paraburkholderia TaxID=2615204 RepID=UPI00104A0468